MAGSEELVSQQTPPAVVDRPKQPTSFSDFIKLGKKYARKGKYKRAIQSFGQASKIGTTKLTSRAALMAEVRALPSNVLKAALQIDIHS